MAVVNQFTRDKRWRRLQKIDATIAAIRKRSKELYAERIQLVEDIYGGCERVAKNAARPGANVREHR